MSTYQRRLKGVYSLVSKISKAVDPSEIIEEDYVNTTVATFGDAEGIQDNYG